MAIKINNVAVINDSRELVNVTNIKTINGQSILGTGTFTSNVVPTQGTLESAPSASGTKGQIRYNAYTNKFEGFTATAWVSFY